MDARRQPARPVSEVEAVRLDQPVAGHYAMALVKNGPLVPIRLWFGRPVLDGEELDRSPRWNCEINHRTDRVVDGVRELLEFEWAWPWCARNPISEETYRHMVAVVEWATEHAPEHPKANPRQAVDFHTLAPRF